MLLALGVGWKQQHHACEAHLRWCVYRGMSALSASQGMVLRLRLRLEPRPRSGLGSHLPKAEPLDESKLRRAQRTAVAV